MPGTLTGAGPTKAVKVGAEIGLGKALMAECAGTFILVFFGIGAVHAAVLTKAHVLFQVAAIWGIGVTLGIYVSAAVSGAHLNPAITAALAAVGGFPRKKVLPYWGAQVWGGFLAAAAVYLIFGGLLAEFETAAGLTRGGPGSEATAMCYGEYFPNPGSGLKAESVSESRAFLIEFLCTAVLAFVIFALTAGGNNKAPGALTPLFIGLTVTGLVSLIAPLTQCCLNPARDFGPRLYAWFAGWGGVAIPGPRGGFFTVYILAPILGGVFGGLVYRLAIKPGMDAADRSGD
jgi:glycerol uptake facilitator